METNTLLYIAFIIYIVIMVFGYLFKINWIYIIAGMLWFIPIIEIENMFIILISVIMIIAHGILGFTLKNDESGF